MRLVQPPNTTKYEVASSDTLARIALRYNTTPTELSRLNHLSSSLLYPGQTLFVPDKAAENEKETKNDQNIALLANNSTNEQFPVIEVMKKDDLSIDNDMSVASARRFFHNFFKSFSPDKHLDDLLSNDRLHSSDDEVSRKYLKLKSKYVTDGQGVVSGVVLITPQTVMFNPCVSDHLVMERGREMYVVRLPLRAISKIILFEDIAAMVVGDMSKQYIPKISFIDYASELHLSPKPGMIVCQETGETYALHTNFERSTMNRKRSEENSQEDLSDDILFNQHESKEEEEGDQSSIDQGISSSEQINSDSTVKDVTMIAAAAAAQNAGELPALMNTDDLPAVMNNECTSCQNFSDFIEDSQFSSTPKHKPLQDVSNLEEATGENDDQNNDVITYNENENNYGDNVNNYGDNKLNSYGDNNKNNYGDNELNIIETNLTMFNNDKDVASGSSSSCRDSGEGRHVLNDQLVDDMDLLTTGKGRESFENEDEFVTGSNVENSLPEEAYTHGKTGSSSSNSNFDSILPESEIALNKCQIDVAAVSVDEAEEMDDIAATMVENHFNITPENTCDVLDNINDSQETNFKQNRTDMKSAYFDESKDSGISDVSSAMSNQTNESKEFIRGPIARGSSLSAEARQWLGKRGVHLSLDKRGEAHYKSDTYEEDIETQELVTPRPASKVDDPLMYVAIKVHKSYWCPIRAKQNQIMGVPPNRDQKRREHWFAIPRERVDQFYNFLLYWAPEVCGEDTSGFSTPCSSEHEVEDKSSRSDVSGMTMRRSWSLYSVASKSSTRRTPAEGDVDTKSITQSLCEDEIPDLQAESHILTRKQVHLLTRKLPSRTVGHSWELIYSTTIHGISLSTLYRNFIGYDIPVLIVVKDENQKVFGAFMSESPRVSEGFYGTGESLLFTFTSDTTLKTFNWTGENNFFIKGSKSSMVIGGGEGIFGLWLDEDLYRGRSHSCETFANDTLSSSEDFICCGLEAWGFV